MASNGNGNNKDKKWSAEAERDLAIAIIMSQQGERVKYDWPKAHELMEGWDYNFSRDAISQHWTKKIMKDFKAQHGPNAAKASPSPRKNAATPKKGPGSRGGAKKRQKPGDENEGDDEQGTPTNTPSKRKRDMEVKQEDEHVVVKKDENDDNILLLANAISAAE